MSARRIVLIDSDEDFFRTLHEQVTPYGFEIYRVDESQDTLGYIQDVGPQLIFIAVEEPDKVGYSLCNKAKKSVARDIPLVLTTRSVPPEGFASHRKLKVHADEYIDKRIMSADELLNKVHGLVGLGEVPMEEMSFDEVEEFDISVDAFGDSEDDKTRIAAPQMMFDVDMDPDTSATVASLTGGSGGFEPGLDDDIATSAPIPEPRGQRAPSSGVPEVLDDTGVPEAYRTAAPPATRDSGLISSTEVRSASGTLNAPARPGAAPRAAGHEPAGQKAADPHILQKMQEIERENERLKAELDKARQAGVESGGTSSLARDREILSLRETINKKEREILDLRDEVGSKERQILEGKDQVHQLQYAKTMLDSKNLELEQRLLEKTEELTKLEARASAAEAQAGAASQEAAERARLAGELEALKQEHARALAALEQKLTAELALANKEHESALAGVRGEYETKLAGLGEEHAAALARAKAEAEAAGAQSRQAHQQELGALREQHAAELAQAEERHKNELARSLAEAESALRATMDGAHAAALAELRSERDEIERGLTSARQQIDQLTGALAERDQAIAGYGEDLGKRDARIGELSQEFAALEAQASELQGQLLRAYQKIKSDEAAVSKAKRALAVALTLLDEHIAPIDAAAEMTGEPSS